MSDIVIAVEGLTKAYRIWKTPAHRLLSPMQAQLARLAPGPLGAALRRRAAAGFRDFYALRDVNFEVRRGEAVGIIGRNGSGKSTLLQLIAGTLQATAGSVRVHGRIAALLELGSGFNPEFTGRENVYLNAAVLGLSRAQVDQRFDAIAAFADIGDFLDQPVKTYSSGMMLRLAFAVQIQLDPEILIVDEALAVGDEPFQRKCFTQIAMMQERGVAILLVSHAAATVVELCQRAVLLDHGEQLLVARPKIAVQHYHQLCYAPAENFARIRAEVMKVGSAHTGEACAPSTKTRQPAAEEPKSAAYFLESMISASRSEFSRRSASIDTVGLLDSDYRPVNVLVKGDDYSLRWRVQFTANAHRVRFGWTAKTLSGVIISGAATHPEGDGFEGCAAGEAFEVTFRFRCLFNPGTYFIDVGARAELGDPDTLVHGINDALMFKVQPTPRTHRNGYIDCSLDPVWTVVPAAQTAASPVDSAPS